MLAIPPVSDRGLQLPPIEASRIFSMASKKNWFAVYTAPRHEKFVQAQLTAKQIQSFLPLYSVVRRWKNGVRREIQHPLFPGYVFVCLDANERLPVLQTAGVVYIVGNGTHLYLWMIRRCTPSASAPTRIALSASACIRRATPSVSPRGPFKGVRGRVQRDRRQFDICRHHSAYPEVFCDRRARLRSRIGRVIVEQAYSRSRGTAVGR